MLTVGSWLWPTAEIPNSLQPLGEDFSSNLLQVVFYYFPFSFLCNQILSSSERKISTWYNKGVNVVCSVCEHLKNLFTWVLIAVRIHTLVRRKIMIKMFLMNSDRSNMGSIKYFLLSYMGAAPVLAFTELFIPTSSFPGWCSLSLGIAVWTQHPNSCSDLWQSQHLCQVFTMAMYYCSKKLLWLGQKRQGKEKSPKNNFSSFVYK